MCVQASSIISSNIYRDDDKPLYRRGNKVLIVICAYNVFLFIGAKLYYKRINTKRDLIWNAMGKEERETYLETTKDNGNKRQAPRLPVVNSYADGRQTRLSLCPLVGLLTAQRHTIIDPEDTQWVGKCTCLLAMVGTLLGIDI